MHDIGKNIVGVVLGCNGYEVIDLGVMVPAEKILHAAKEHGAQAIGLSGLITPSLEEMSHVAAEMKRQGFELPLFDRRRHHQPRPPAIKIAPHYDQPVVYVPDASRAVGVVTALLSEGGAEDFKLQLAADYEKLRAQHANKKGVQLVSIEAARANAFRTDWSAEPVAACSNSHQAGFQPYTPPEPNTLGVMALDVDLNELRDYIDWGRSSRPGTWPAASRGSSTTKWWARPRAACLPTPGEMLEDLIAQEWLQAKAAFGIFPANSVGDDIEFYDDESREAPIMTWFGLRQQHERPRASRTGAWPTSSRPRRPGCATGAAPLR